jgi:hypothetical protein
MGYRHLLLEVYCCYDFSEERTSEIPKYCRYGINNPGYHCFSNDCPFKGFAECPNELAFVGEFGEVKDEESFVGFGGEMDSDDDKEKELLLNLWSKISKKKIDEAYEEYMKLKKQILK